MRIASWNVNSLKVRLPQVLDWCAKQKPDVLALQETKLTDAAFPVDAIAEVGYRAVFAGQKTYNGVAILSREPASDIVTSVPGLEDDPQRRILGATIGGVRVLDLYVVNGQEVGSDKFAYKLRWLEAVRRYVCQQARAHTKFVVLGDFNIAPGDRDVYDPVAWAGRVLCSEPERQAFQGLLDCGLVDSYRLFEQPAEQYSWWDYRAAGFRRNRGLRIDHILVSPALAQVCTASTIDREPRAWERPSDHAPVLADFSL